MMMTVGPRIGIASNPLEAGSADGAAGTAGMGDAFLRMLCGMDSSLTLETGAEPSIEGMPAAEGQENLTIKTFQKLLAVNSGETEPQSAPGDDELTKQEADKLAEGTEAAAMLSIGIAVPTPLAPPTLEGSFTLPPAAGQATNSDARAALLASAFATSPAAAMIVAGKAVTAGTAGDDAPTAEPLAKPGMGVKMPLAQEDTQPVSLKPADTKASQPKLADTAAPVETASVDARPIQPTVLNSFLSAALQPVTGQPAPLEGAAPTAQPGEIVDVALEQQLDLAHEGEWLDRLARDIARTAGAEGGLRFRLNPEHLGSLHVELTQGQAGASLKLTAETEAARAIIADAQPRLVAEARAQGVRIAETHVDLGSGGHMQSGEQRRQDAEQGHGFVRTSRSGAASESETPETAANASERYA